MSLDIHAKLVHVLKCLVELVR